LNALSAPSSVSSASASRAASMTDEFPPSHVQRLALAAGGASPLQRWGPSRRSCSPRRRMSAPPEAAPLLAPCHKYTSGCEVVARPARQLSGARSGNSCPRRDDWQLCVANHRNDPCGGNDPKSPAVMPPTTPIKSVASPRIRPVRSVSARPRPIKRSWIVRHDRDCWRPVTERWARCILVHRRWGVCVDVRRWAAIGGRRWW
jgi:hypothetical protein